MAFGACSNDDIDDLGGKYDEVARYDFDRAKVSPTLKMEKGIKCLRIELENSNGDIFTLAIGTTEWILQPGAYSPVYQPEAITNLTYMGGVNINQPGSLACVEGSLNVLSEKDGYRINGIFNDTDAGKKFVVNFRGPLEFEIGEDDPEPSGYTVSFTKQPATKTDPVTYQPIPLEGLSKYTFKITDPAGNDAGTIEAINATDIETADLAGDYNIVGSPEKAWLVDNGWVVPDWNMAGGTYFVNAKGEKRYVTGGVLNISFATGINGEQLINISGAALPAVKADGSDAGTENTSIKFAQLLVSSGTELRDLKLQSAVLGKEIAYSVYLPEGYDPSRQYPVLYMLNGASGNNNDWLQQGLVASYAASAGKDMVIVFPNGCPDGFDSFYINGYNNGGLNYEDLFFSELLPKVESDFNIKPGKGNRGIAGLSMGGYGSLYYGLSHPDMFCYIYACSPATYVEGTPNLYDMLWTEGLPGITVEIGTSDFLYESAKGFREALGYSQINWDFIERDGAHDWAFWSVCTPKILKKFAEVFE